MTMTPPLLHPFSDPTSTDFRTIVRGDGAWVFDDKGEKYFDAMSSLWYCNVGHGRADIADAMSQQARRLAGFHTFESFSNEPADRLARLIVERGPLADSRVFFADSGSEAIDSAIKLAHVAHSRNSNEAQKTLLVGMANSYHGMAYGGQSIAGIEANRAQAGPLLENTVRLPRNDVDAAEEFFIHHGHDTAAVFIEIVSGSGGVDAATPQYLHALRRLCTQYGAFLVFDEVITGFGRLGHFFATSATQVTPDLITFAKGITSGYAPLGGVLLGSAIVESLESSPFTLRHGYTYSGHPVACAAAIAVIQILEHEDLFTGADDIATILGQGLHRIAEDRPIHNVRGVKGLWAVDLDQGLDQADLRTKMVDLGVITRPVGVNSIAFCPPLVSTSEQLEGCLNVFDKVLADA